MLALRSIVFLLFLFVTVAPWGLFSCLTFPVRQPRRYLMIAKWTDIAVWGDPTVLAINTLPPVQRARFAAKPLPGQVARTAPTLPEPHGSWVEPIEKAWTSRYGR